MQETIKGEIGANFRDGREEKPWNVNGTVAAMLVASDVSFGRASRSMQSLGCGITAKSEAIKIRKRAPKITPEYEKLTFMGDSFYIEDQSYKGKVEKVKELVLLPDGKVFGKGLTFRGDDE